MEPLPAVVEKRKSEAERESREEGEATQMGQVRFSVILLVYSSFKANAYTFLLFGHYKKNHQLPEECVREILSRLSDSSDLDRAGEYDATTPR